MNNPLRAWRLEQGLSQNQAALMFGVNLRSFRRWESGESFPPPSVMANIQAVVGHPLFYAVWFLWYCERRKK